MAWARIPANCGLSAGRQQIFHAGRATLEVFDGGQAAAVDDLKVGQRISELIRFAFQVPDVRAARELAYGADLVHMPVLTPWNDFYARMCSPDGLQVTMFQVMEG